MADRGGDPPIIIAGPTATGKSALALAAAEAVGGVVINADSMQVYRDLRILTARPDADAMARADHRLYGVLSADERCSAGRWRELALAEIDAARRDGKRPILVGGTGLYLRALMVGLAPVPPVCDEIRRAGEARRAAIGAEAFHAELVVRDPASAARLFPGDTQRVVRAWAVWEATGRSLTEWRSTRSPIFGGSGVAGVPDGDGPGPEVAPEPWFDIYLVMPQRDVVYAACDRRFERMVKEGGLDEAAALADRRLPPDAPILKALGVPQLIAHLRGEMSLNEAVALAQRQTRRYAKRQLTWFRHQIPDAGALPVRRRQVISAQLSERLVMETLTIIRNTR